MCVCARALVCDCDFAYIRLISSPPPSLTLKQQQHLGESKCYGLCLRSKAWVQRSRLEGGGWPESVKEYEQHALQSDTFRDSLTLSLNTEGKSG